MGVSSQAEQAADLGLRPGMVVEVMTPENRLLFVGRVEAVQDKDETFFFYFWYVCFFHVNSFQFHYDSFV